MTRYAALIRGINVGGNKKLVMAELRELLSALGNSEVSTHLNSGNAVFTSVATDPAAVAEAIEQGVARELGLSVRCLIRTGAEIQAVIAANPLREMANNNSRLMAHFLSSVPEPGLLEAHDPQTLDSQTIALGDRVIYQWCPEGVLKAPPVGGYAEKHLRVTVTARNWNTVTKLGVLLDA